MVAVWAQALTASGGILRPAQDATVAKKKIGGTWALVKRTHIPKHIFCWQWMISQVVWSHLQFRDYYALQCYMMLTSELG